MQAFELLEPMAILNNRPQKEQFPCSRSFDYASESNRPHQYERAKVTSSRFFPYRRSTVRVESGKAVDLYIQYGSNDGIYHVVQRYMGVDDISCIRRTQRVRFSTQYAI